jgi:Zn-dependent peptidase ImmA (M78 family)
MPATVVPTLHDRAVVSAVPATLRLLRERRGLLKKDVAEALGKSAPWLTKVEAGDLPVTGETLDSYAALLDARPELLTAPIHVEPPEGVHFRSQKVSQRTRHQAIAAANVAAHAVNELLNLVDSEPAPSWPEFDVDSLPQGAHEAAQLVRLRLRLHGPIPDIAASLESMGIFVLPMPPEITGIDAVTIRTDGQAAAIILLSSHLPEDRKRHTLAHELGHLVLDRLSLPLSMKDVEGRVDAFAGELLAPYDEVRNELKGITPSALPTLMALHREWGVSPSAFIRRARLHDDISETQYRYWFKVLASRSLLRGLPSAFPVRASAARELLTALHTGGYTLSDLLEATRLRPSQLAQIFGEDDWPYHQPRPRLRTV